MSYYNTVDKYKSLIDAIGYLNSSMKVEEVLRSLLVKSVELVENADTGLIFIYNNERDCLEVKSAYGFESGAFSILIRPGESITGEAFVQNKTLVVNGVERVRQYMSAISFYSESGNNPDDLLGKDINTIKGVICCPLRIKDQCVGVLVVDNFTQNTDFTDLDVEILEAISVQAALAIENARTYESSESNRLALDKYSKLVEAERNTYRHAIRLHNKFTEMVLTGASMQDLIDEIAFLLDSDVFFMDTFLNIEVLCSNCKLSHKQVEAIHLTAVENAALTSVRYLTIEEWVIRVQPVIVDHNNIGWIIIIRNSAAYSEEDETAIERGITIMALEIIKIRQIQAIEEKYRGEFIDTLLLNQNEAAIKQYAKDYHLDFTKPLRLILIEFTEHQISSEGSQRSQGMNQIITYYSQYISRFIAEQKDRIFVASKLKAIIIILPSELYPRREIEFFFKALFDNFKSNPNAAALKVGMNAIASETFTGSHAFGTIYSNSNKMLRHILDTQMTPQWSFYEDSKVKQLLLRSNPLDLNAFMIDTLGPLLDTGPTNQELLRTLKLYVSSNGNWTTTKEALFIHGNTLTYRLKRISHILNVDLNEYYGHLHIQLALEILEMFPLNNEKNLEELPGPRDNRLL